MPERRVDEAAVPSEPQESGSIEGVTRTTTGTSFPLRSAAEPTAGARLVERDRSRYQVIAEHGRGGLGRVMRARDTELARDVAIKEILHSDFAAEERFIREAMITARLEHPGIVPVHDAGRWPDGTPFYSMKLVAGRPLKDVIASASSLKQRLALLPHVIAVAEAISYAHSRGIIHRDLKPSNIIVGDFGETVVIDWGLAKQLGAATESGTGTSAATGDPSLTRVGAVMGTPAYMPPEQAHGLDVTELADVYALGAVLHHVLVGTPPDPSDRRGSRTPPAMSALAPRVAPELAAIVTKAMQPDPTRRYSRADDFVEDLRRYQTGELVAAHRYSASRLLGRWISRNRIPIAAFALLVATVIGLAMANRRITAQERAAREAERGQRSSALTLRAAQLRQFQELGRLALLAEDPMRALPYLSAAYSAGVETKSLLFLIASALHKLPTATIVHRGWVTNVDMTRDGRFGLSCGTDGSIHLWRADSKDPAPLLASLTLGGERIWDCHFSPDGRQIVAAGGAGTVAVFDVATRATLRRWQADPKWLFAARWSPDGQELATAGSNGHLLLWGAEKGDLRSDLEGAGGPLRGAAFSPDNRHVVAWGYASGSFKLWDLESGNHALQIEAGKSSVKIVAFDPSGTRLVAADFDGRTTVWDVATGHRLRILDAPAVRMSELEFSPDGTLILGASTDRRAYLWDARSGTRKRVLTGSAGTLNGARFSPDGNRILAFGSDGWSRVYDTASGSVIDAFHGHAGQIRSAVWSPDSSRVATGSFDGSMRLWEVGADAPVVVLANFGDSGSAIPLPDGDRLLTAGTTVHLWRLRDGQELGRVDPGVAEVTAMDVARDGHTVVFGGGDGAVSLVDIDSGGRPRLFPGTGPVQSVAISADAQRIAVVRGTGNAQRGVVFSSLDGSILPGSLEGEVPQDLFFSPDGETLAEVTGDSSVYLLDRALKVRTPPGRLSGESVNFDATGRRLVVTGSDGRNIAQVIDAPSGKPLAVLEGHSDGLSAGRFSPDGSFVVTVGADSTVRLWESSTGALLNTWELPENVLGCVHFDSTGTRVMACSIDGRVRIWTLPDPPPSAAMVESIVRCKVPYHIEDGQLVPSVPDPSACPAASLLSPPPAGTSSWSPRPGSGESRPSPGTPAAR